MKYRSSANSNGSSVATKGKLAATQTTTKYVKTTSSHIFKKFIETDFKLAAHFHSFAKTNATGQNPTVYVLIGKPQKFIPVCHFCVPKSITTSSGK